MSIAGTPIAALLRGQRRTGDGVHLVARDYKKGVRLDTHMHREAQLVYAARCGAGLCQRSRLFPRVPAGHRQDTDGVFRNEIRPIRP
jgi:hypothetical protein